MELRALRLAVIGRRLGGCRRSGEKQNEGGAGRNLHGNQISAFAAG